MTEYSIVDANMSHVEFVASNMRKADREEAWAQTGIRPEAALGGAFGYSDFCKVGLADGVPICIFGVTPLGGLEEGVGSPWMVSTVELPRHAKKFLRECGGIVGMFHDLYPRLENYVDARNTIAIRWLKWLGFVIMEPVNHGPYGMLFYPFYRVRA